MSSAEWTPAAESDAEDIYGWIAFRDGRRSAAKKVIRELREVCDEYANAVVAGSVLGTSRQDLRDAFRAFTFMRWVVVFRPTDRGIEVMRVLDGSRDFSRIFGD